MPSFRTEQADIFSSLPLLRKLGLRREKSLLAFADLIATLGWKEFRIILFVCSPLLLFVFSLSAQTPDPVPLAHGNVPGEPHHHLKIENEYVRVYYVQVPPHEDTQLHQHDHDYIYVSLGPADVVNAVRDKPEVHLVLKDGETHFTRGGFAHVARNLADTPFRNVTIELLHPQGEVHNFCEKIVDGPVLDCSGPFAQGFSSAFGVNPLIYTEEIAAFYQSLPVEVNVAVHPWAKTALLVACDRSDLSFDLPGQPARTLHSGEVQWVSAGSTPRITALGNVGTARLLVVSFRDSNRSQNP